MQEPSEGVRFLARRRDRSTVECGKRWASATVFSAGGLVCELAVRGVWNPQTQMLFDFKIVNMDAHSYVNRPVRAILESAAAMKRSKHKEACVDHRADFTPFMCSTDGAIHREGQHFPKRLAARLAPQSGTWPILELWASFVNECPSGIDHCIRDARRKFFSLTPQKPEPRWLLSCNN